MGLYLVGRHGELQASGWALGKGAHGGGGRGLGMHPTCSPSRSPVPQGGAPCS